MYALNFLKLKGDTDLKKKYAFPSLEIVALNSLDVLCTSDEDVLIKNASGAGDEYDWQISVRD